MIKIGKRVRYLWSKLCEMCKVGQSGNTQFLVVRSHIMHCWERDRPRIGLVAWHGVPACMTESANLTACLKLVQVVIVVSDVPVQ